MTPLFDSNTEIQGAHERRQSDPPISFLKTFKGIRRPTYCFWIGHRTCCRLGGHFPPSISHRLRNLVCPALHSQMPTAATRCWYSQSQSHWDEDRIYTHWLYRQISIKMCTPAAGPLDCNKLSDSPTVSALPRQASCRLEAEYSASLAKKIHFKGDWQWHRVA